MDEVSQLKTILKNSFSGIKQDISELKEKQDEAISTNYKLKQDVDKIKDDYVPKDKLNLLKIKVGEINNTLKKIWDLDSSIKTLEENKTDKKDFEKRFDLLKEEIAKQLSEINSNTGKRLIEYANEVNKNIEAVNNNSAKVFSKINEQMKSVVTKSQLKSMADDVRQEFISIKREVTELRKIKETITASELEKRTNLINARVDLLAKEVLKTNKNVSECITQEQVKSLIAEINKEFNDLKISSAEVSKLKRYVSMVESDSLSKKQFSSELSTINSDIDDAKKEIRELRSTSKSFAKYDDMEKTVSKIEITLTRKLIDLEKEVTALKRFERRYDDDISSLKTQILKAQSQERQVIAQQTAPQKVDAVESHAEYNMYPLMGHNVHSIQDKCKAINFVIGRVYRSSNNGTDGIRNKIRINSDLYNEFEDAEREGNKKRMIKALDKINKSLENLRKSEKNVFGSKAKKFKNLIRDTTGNSSIIDVLSKNDKDPVMNYYMDAVDAFNDLKRKLNQEQATQMTVKSEPIKSVPITAKVEVKPDFKQLHDTIKQKRRPYLALSIISVILIVLAFASLGGAIVAYFALEPALTNYMTLGAVVFFVVGIILRAVLIKKRK